MKKILILALMFIFSLPFLSSNAHSAKKGFTVSLKTNLITNRDMEEEGEEAKIKSHQYLGIISYGERNLTFSLLLGKASLETHLAEGETTWFGENFAWGFGIKDEIYGNNNYRIEGEVQYLTFKPQKGKTTGVCKDAYNSGGEVEINCCQWQVSSIIIKDFPSFTLYGGMKYSDFNGEQERIFPTSTQKTKFKSPNNFGLLGGINIPFRQRVKTNFAIKFVEETAFTFGLSYKL